MLNRKEVYQHFHAYRKQRENGILSLTKKDKMFTFFKRSKGSNDTHANPKQ